MECLSVFEGLQSAVLNSHFKAVFQLYVACTLSAYAHKVSVFAALIADHQEQNQ